jgi:glycosyltransferase involved in cell wall biosynthesis
MQNRPKIVLSITSTFCLGFLRGQSKFLKENGFDVYLFSPAGEGLKEYGESEGCTIVEVPYKREISLSSDLKCLFITIRLLRKIKPDIINVGTPKSGLIGVLAGRILGIKNRIFTLRGLRSTAEPEGTTKKIVEFMETFTHNCANYVISITPSMANYAIENNILDKEKTVILAKASSNGINVEKFTLEKDKIFIDELKQEFSINENDFVIGFVGRVVKSKGVEEIYMAFFSLSQRYANLKFLVIGPIEDTSDSISSDILQRMKADKNVIFTGQRKDVDYLYHLMNVFSLPSHNFREGFGNVAMEASASGVPIVVSRGAGCQDAILDGETGILVNPMSVEQLENAFEFYINNKAVAITHGLNGRKFAVDFFKNEIIWDAQLEFYNKLIDRSK